MRLSKGRDFYDDEYSEGDEIYDDKEDEPRKLCFPERMVGRRNELARMQHFYDELCRDADRRTGDLPFFSFLDVQEQGGRHLYRVFGINC
jgi:hypothetical protein